MRALHPIPLRKAVALLGVAFTAAVANGRTALDRYVAVEDPNYRFSLAKTIEGEEHVAYVVDMVSQAWLTPAEVDRPVWQHWLTIIKPAKVISSTGLLYIAGGSNGSQPPDRVDPMLVNIARQTGSVVAELRMVPNQPLRFAGDPLRRNEDSLIAYAWDKYLRGGDEKWLPRLPMTKAAVKAMDTVTAFLKGNVNVDKFVVTGGSKRGWTAWTTAAVDKRVVAVIPMVIDLLNIEPSFVHHWRAYGFWAPAVRDYVDMNIMKWMGRPEYRNLLKIVEPYEYRDRLTMPKYMINASGDQFFLPDSSQFYFDDLRGEKFLRYVPNADHSLRNSDAAQSLLAFFQSIINQRPRPRFSWKNVKDGSIRLKVHDRPSEVKLWQATNPKARDFRLMTIGPAWKSSPVQAKSDEYVASVPRPEQGWTAFFLELTYPGGGKFTTSVQVVPDVLPFPPPKP